MAQLKPKNLKLAFQLVFEGQWPTSVAFLGSGERLAAANRAGEIYIWDLSREPSEEKIAENKERYKDRKAPSLSPVQRLEGHTNAISHLVATRDGKQLISASYDHTIRIWKQSLPARPKR